MSVRKGIDPLHAQLRVLEAEYQSALAACPQRQRGELVHLLMRIDALREHISGAASSR